MSKSPQPIQTTHAGSLPRPPALAKLLVSEAHGEPVDARELRALGLEAVRVAVEKQRQAGITIVGNGEQQRTSFFLYLKDRLSGLGGSWSRPVPADANRYPGFVAMMRQQSRERAVSHAAGLPMAVAPVAYLNEALAHEEAIDFRAALDEAGGGFADAFLTAPSPGFLLDSIRNDFYDGDKAYLDALADAMNVEYRAIAGEGFQLQVDAPDLGSRFRAYHGRPMSEFLDFVELAIAALNRALKGVPRGRVRLHVCWGNYEGPHDLDVPLKDLLPILRKADVGGFVLPFANPRHAHEYRLLPSLLGDDRFVVAGVIDTTTNFIEHPEVVADRLERVVNIVGDASRVIAGTDCGLSTAVGGSRVAADIAWAKLAAMSEGARLASQRLAASARRG
jgi:5-methyltetrahydropteroyltriglutamate--homocysteine methyltransferase